MYGFMYGQQYGQGGYYSITLTGDLEWIPPVYLAPATYHQVLASPVSYTRQYASPLQMIMKAMSPVDWEAVNSLPAYSGVIYNQAGLIYDQSGMTYNGFDPDLYADHPWTSWEEQQLP